MNPGDGTNGSPVQRRRSFHCQKQKLTAMRLVPKITKDDLIMQTYPESLGNVPIPTHSDISDDDVNDDRSVASN